MTRTGIRFLTIAVALTLGTTGPGLAAVSDWVSGDRAKVRLLVAGLDADGTLQAGIEIALAPGWKTYWRTPGAAGIAPRPDFSASTNVADAEVRYPVPHRYDDGYAVSNVYEGEVVLPVEITPGDGARPLHLRLSLDIGVCEEVCIPERFDVELPVSPGVTDAVAARILSEAHERLPGPPEPGKLAVREIARSGGTDKRPEYAVSVAVLPDLPIDVFVEGPADWYAGVPERIGEDAAGATYRVAFDRLGARTPLEDARFVVTIVAPDRAVEQSIGLD